MFCLHCCLSVPFGSLNNKRRSRECNFNYNKSSFNPSVYKLLKNNFKINLSIEGYQLDFIDLQYGFHYIIYPNQNFRRSGKELIINSKSALDNDEAIYIGEVSFAPHITLQERE